VEDRVRGGVCCWLGMVGMMGSWIREMERGMDIRRDISWRRRKAGGRWMLCRFMI